MKVKTSELTAPALDWAVAKCEGLLEPGSGPLGTRLAVVGRRKVVLLFAEGDLFEPSSDWAQGGPIIDREGVATHRNGKLVFNSDDKRWQASLVLHLDEPPPRLGFGPYYGPTLLTAAMRCYVASKLGDEIDIPEELA